MRLLLITIIALAVVGKANAQGEYYFPTDSTKKGEVLAEYGNKSYSKVLSVMKEPVLYKDKSDGESYRFDWFRSFHNPVAIRIEKKDDAYMLYWKVYDDMAHSSEVIKIDKYRAITKANWELFKNKLKKLGYWQMRTNEIRPADEVRIDGSSWLLEGKVKDEYHVVDRWMPDAKTAYYQVCDYLIGLTGLKIAKYEKY